MEEKHINVLITVEAICIVIYSVMLAFITYIIWVYVIKQKRYKTFLVSVFYFLTVLLIACRIGMLVSYVTAEEEGVKSAEYNFELGD